MNSFSMFNTFLVNVPILYLLKIPENQSFSGVFVGYKMRTLARNGFNVKVMTLLKLWWAFKHTITTEFISAFSVSRREPRLLTWQSKNNRSEVFCKKVILKI